MANFLQQVVSGLATGGIFASLALALVLIYRATRVINFAQGEMGMFSAFIALWLIDSGWPYWAAFFATLGIAFVGGVAVERVVIRPVERAPVVTVVIVTVGLLIGLNGAAFWIWGGDTRAFPSAFSTRAIHVGGVAFSIQDIGVIGVSLGMVALLYVFFRFTKLGLAMRGAALNPNASRLVGVRVGWMLALGWGLASVLGAVSAMMIAPTVFLDPNMMRPVLLYAIAAAILGGLESPLGAVVGGLALGVGLNLVSTYVGFVGDALKLPVAFIVILAVLLVKPTGLFGRATVRRV
jgi:branched-chain amino acid transport system permease protein